MAIRKGTTVSWSWGNGTATGKVGEIFTRKVTRTLKGASVTRNATKSDPAYLIVQDDGDEILKSRSEIERA